MNQNLPEILHNRLVETMPEQTDAKNNPHLVIPIVMTLLNREDFLNGSVVLVCNKEGVFFIKKKAPISELMKALKL